MAQETPDSAATSRVTVLAQPGQVRMCRVARDPRPQNDFLEHSCIARKRGGPMVAAGHTAPLIQEQLARAADPGPKLVFAALSTTRSCGAALPIVRESTSGPVAQDHWRPRSRITRWRGRWVSPPAGSPGSSGAVVTSPGIAAIVTLGFMRRGRGAPGIYPANSKSMVISGSMLVMIPE